MPLARCFTTKRNLVLLFFLEVLIKVFTVSGYGLIANRAPFGDRTSYGKIQSEHCSEIHESMANIKS